MGLTDKRIMAQIDNFRKVLGLTDPDKTQDGAEQETSAVKRENRISSRKDGRFIKSITINEDTYALLKALSFWHSQHEGKKTTMSSMLEELVETYLAENPEIKRFVESNT